MLGRQIKAPGEVMPQLLPTFMKTDNQKTFKPKQLETMPTEKMACAKKCKPSHPPFTGGKKHVVINEQICNAHVTIHGGGTGVREVRVVWVAADKNHLTSEVEHHSVNRLTPKGGTPPPRVKTLKNPWS